MIDFQILTIPDEETREQVNHEYGLASDDSVALHCSRSYDSEEDLYRVLNHEILHTVLWNVEGQKASLGLDNIESKWYRITDDDWELEAEEWIYDLTEFEEGMMEFPTLDTET